MLNLTALIKFIIYKTNWKSISFYPRHYLTIPTKYLLIDRKQKMKIAQSEYPQ